jgi:hypothetical protein
VHSFVSFPFVLGLCLIAAMWLRDNIPRKVDIDWLREGGSFVGGRHPAAGRFNAGGKLVVWLALAAGVTVAVSGYVLMFSFYVTKILGMQAAHVVHSIVAMLFIALIIGHIYIGTWGWRERSRRCGPVASISIGRASITRSGSRMRSQRVTSPNHHRVPRPVPLNELYRVQRVVGPMMAYEVLVTFFLAHMVTAAYLTTSFVVLAVRARYLLFVKPLPAAGLLGGGRSTAAPSLVSEVVRSSYGAPIASADVRPSYRDVRLQVGVRSDMSRAHRIPSDNGDLDATLARRP